MKHIIVAVALLVSGSAFASFFETCEFQTQIGSTQKLAKLGETVREYQNITEFKIIGAVSLGGHTDCSGHIGKSKWLETGDQSFLQDEEAFLKLEHTNDDLPSGYVMSEEWAVMPHGGLLTARCHQINRALPRYEIELRMPSGMVTTDRTYHNVVVLRDAEAIAYGENIEERANPLVASLKTLVVDKLKIKFRISDPAVENFTGELRLADNTTRRLACSRLK